MVSYPLYILSTSRFLYFNLNIDIYVYLLMCMYVSVCFYQHCCSSDRWSSVLSFHHRSLGGQIHVVSLGWQQESLCTEQPHCLSFLHLFIIDSLEWMCTFLIAIIDGEVKIENNH